MAGDLGLGPEALAPYGRDKAKLLSAPSGRRPGKLILVTSMTPTRQGSGKTVTSIGLGQAFGKLGLRHCICLREPSLGPTLGIKGGGAGGGHAQLLPMEDINLHFTGDMHAIGTAHNLLAAFVDNHVHFDNSCQIDPQAIEWPRVMDLCDRQLRQVQVGLGGDNDGFPHGTRFDITAASEVMAIVALASDGTDLRARLQRVVVGRDMSGQPVLAGDLGVVGAMEVLLKDTLYPNLVQTLEGTPALVHCGPFANIAHGCNSIIATRTALTLSDYVITEAGFGADLGAEKFVHIKCRTAGLHPDAAVLVVTMKALRRHGGAGKGKLGVPDAEAVQGGLENVAAHLESMARFGIPCVVALNLFPQDSAAEIASLRDFCQACGAPFAISEAFAKGGAGAVELAQLVKAMADQPDLPLRPVYELNSPLLAKIESLATQVYGADGVELSPQAQHCLERLQSEGHGALPICMAKTPYSLSDVASRRGRPRGWKLQVRDAQLRAGAGMVVVLTGSTVTMPGMPRRSAAERLGLDGQGNIVGMS